MSKKHTKNEQTDDTTELNADLVAEMASDVAEIARRLSSIAQKMKDKDIASVHARGVPTWKDAFKRIKGSTGSIERAWENESTIAKTIAEKRDQYKSTGKK